MRKVGTKKAMVNVPEKGLLALVASKLKDTVLFPEKLERAKKYIDKAKMKTT
ncbi:MAG: hypothetical protein JST68_08475 [Bacteroidetes bacterium]|nr:hypothetical protein [Bacteroidota bacterium]